MSAGGVCFVTDELHPCTPGGIGRLVHNLIRRELERGGTEIHVLLPDHLATTDREVSAAFGERLTIHRAKFRSGWDPLVTESGIYPPAAAFTDTPAHAHSLDLMLALREIGRQHALSYIEFPDYRGWAFATLNEKKLGLAFQSSTVVVRLHSAAAIIAHHENALPTGADVAMYEMERLSLLHADLVVGHLAPVADATRDFFGFTQGWRERVRIELPPVAEGLGPGSGHRAPPENPGLLFCTKIQPFKRPDLFVRAAAAFIRQRPDFGGQVVLACRSIGPSYTAQIQRLVPTELADRFVFTDSGQLRAELSSRSVVVVPSDYESLNLTAYEMASAGATLVLNRRCPAFDPRGTPWRDGQNCHLFDGSVEGLVQALGRAVDAPHPERITLEVNEPYWNLPRSPSKPPPKTSEPRVSVVITNYNLGAYLPETLRSVARIHYDNLEVVLVDDCSTDELDRALVSELADGPELRVLRNVVNRGLAASRNIGVRAATGQYVLPLDADDCLSPEFVATAVRALEGAEEFGVAIPTAAYFDSDPALEERRFSDWACFLGGIGTLGLLANRYGCATSLIRRSLLLRHPYDESLDSYEDWDLYSRLARSGVGFLVTNQVQFFYRLRPGSMIRGVERSRHFALMRRLHANLRAAPGSAGTDALIARMAELESLVAEVSSAAAQVSRGLEQPGPSRDAAEEIPLRYRLADRLNAVVKRAPVVHPVLKRVLGRAGGPEKKGSTE